MQRSTFGLLLGLSLGCAEDSCFVGATLIDTPHGKRPLADLQIGDAIWSFDEKTRRLVQRTVKSVMRDRVRLIVRIKTASTTIAGVTPAHPFYMVQRASYVPFRDLPSDAHLLVLSMGEAPLEEAIEHFTIEESHLPAFEVFNIETDGAEHNYFANGVLVHNKEPVERCGNGHVEFYEACDDGNLRDGDGCSSSCRIETPGGGAAGSAGQAGSAGAAGDSAAGGANAAGGTGTNEDAGSSNDP